MGRGTRVAVRLHGLLVPAKVGLAAGLAAALATRWVPQDVISATFVAVVCSRPAVSSAVREAVGQVVASALGMAVAVIALAIAGPGAVAIGAAIAVTWWLASALRWGYPTLVVALFAVVYQGALTQGSWTDVAEVRGAAILLGVAAALVVNVATAPLLGRANLLVRLGSARAHVQALLAALASAVQAGDATAVAAAARAVEPLYRELDAVRGDLADLRRDARLVRGLIARPGGAGRDRAARAANDLERVVHHAHDAADAACALLGGASAAGAAPAPGGVEGEGERARVGPGSDASVLAAAGAALEGAVAALDAAGAGRYDEAGALARAAGRRVRELDAATAAPAEVASRLGPRLMMMVALAELLDHVAAAAGALEGLAEAEGRGGRG